ncbi:DUF4179 domain-containing protein [Paenibacillus sp. GbtcB18]|uniref:DUF4179 domain-containing protein n=1 Tax=Paenibacillus sp. GbtcB18 TaxID=2824763 RepID=UPI001C307014|nr:DUF4179 domain-containing protein [Paenibacillus sp. GbtcB18]
MKCMKSNQLIAYMENRLSPLESIWLEEHLETCSECRRQLGLYMDTWDSFDAAMSEADVPPDFTEQILDKVTPYVPAAEPAAEDVKANTAFTKDWKKRSVAIVKKITITVASLAIAVSLGTFVSPTFADYVKSFFNNTEKVDQGMIDAVQQGFVHPLDLKTADQGITLEVKEFMADPVRIAVIAEAKGPDGQYIDPDDMRMYVNFVIKDKSGVPVLGPMGGGWTTSKDNHSLMVQQELTEAISSGIEIPDDLIAEIRWTKIGSTSGNWQIDIPIDMSQAKAATKTVMIDKQYTSPQGLTVGLKRAIFAPSVTLLSLDTRISPEVKERIEAAISKQTDSTGTGTLDSFVAHQLKSYQLSYELIDERGQVVAAWDDLFDPGLSIAKRSIVNGISEKEDGGTVTLWHSFSPLPSDKYGKLTFKLHSVYTSEWADFHAKLTPAQLIQKPASLEYNGNQLQFKKFVWKQDEAKLMIGDKEVSDRGGVLEVEAAFAKGVVNLEEWKVKDEKGMEYEAYLQKTSSRDENGLVTVRGALIIPQLDHQPEELTISYNVVQKEHQDVNWQIPIE